MVTGSNPPSAKRSLLVLESSVERFLRIDAMVSGSNPPLAKHPHIERRATSSLQCPGVGITMFGYMERKDLDTAR